MHGFVRTFSVTEITPVPLTKLKFRLTVTHKFDQVKRPEDDTKEITKTKYTGISKVPAIK